MRHRVGLHSRGHPLAPPTAPGGLLDDDGRELVRRMQDARLDRVPRADFSLPPSDPWADARREHERTGFWPISFSSPREVVHTGATPERLLARILPGVPYAYDDETEYLAEYRSAHWAVTHRKGGWDCFRHLEILLAGALPLMPDAGRIPSSAMAHYPRRALAELVERVAAVGPFVSPSAAAQLRQHAARWLTSRQMARYLLRVVGYRGGPIVFIDSSLPAVPDYLSVMTLIGLRQVVGRDVHEWRGVDYVYDDFGGETTDLYGRGFGYTKVLSPSLRSEVPTTPRVQDLIAEVRPTLVVLGSIARAGEEFNHWRDSPPSLRPTTAVLYGEDRGPKGERLELLRNLDAICFIRESDRDLAPPARPRRPPHQAV